jgi:hypothetical protein
MGKLHETLAAEEDQRGKSNKILNETIGTFSNKQQHFIEQTVTFKPYSENEVDRIEGKLELTDTVKSKLNYTAKHVSRYFDVLFQKDLTNTVAKADIKLNDGTVFAKDVPATALLSLQKEVTRLYDLYNVIPTLEPGIKWEELPERGEDIRTQRQEKIRTKKVLKSHVLYEATKEHPAQVKEYTEDIASGVVETVVVTSKLTSREKSEILERLDDLKTAIKKARMRANTQKSVDNKIGQKIFNYINEGKIIKLE